MQSQNIVVKTYKGTQSVAQAAFQQDAQTMAALGYAPTTQNYAPGAYSCGSFIGALLLCLILIGIVVFIYMLIVKPDGTLSVTYELKQPHEIKAIEQYTAAPLDVADQIKKLAELRDQGLLNQEEFDAQKAKLLA